MDRPDPQPPEPPPSDAEPAFDAYYQWLGIPPERQPPNHYALLGIGLLESDPVVIRSAAERQSVHLRTFALGKHQALSQKLLNEVHQARACLLDPQQKAAYDVQFAPQPPPPSPPPVPAGVVTAAGSPGRSSFRSQAILAAGILLAMLVLLLVMLLARARHGEELAQQATGPAGAEEPEADATRGAGEVRDEAAKPETEMREPERESSPTEGTIREPESETPEPQAAKPAVAQNPPAVAENPPANIPPPAAVSDDVTPHAGADARASATASIPPAGKAQEIPAAPTPTKPDKTLTKAPAVAPGLTAAETRAGFVRLFDGRSLAGWQGDPRHYRAEKGLLVSEFGPRGDKGGSLFTVRQYGDFVLRLEYRVSAGANSGLLLHGPGPEHSGEPGLEIQIMDDEATSSARPEYRSASLYGLAAAVPGHQKPAGQWNDMEVICQQRRLSVRLNDFPVVDANLDNLRDKSRKGHSHPGLAAEQGPLGLQASGSQGRVEYRNLRIKEL